MCTLIIRRVSFPLLPIFPSFVRALPLKMPEINTPEKDTRIFFALFSSFLNLGVGYDQKKRCLRIQLINLLDATSTMLD